MSATNIRYAHSIFLILFLPYSSCDSKFQLLPLPTREKQCHISLNDETIMAIPDFTVAIPNTSRCTLPNQFPAIGPNFQAIAVVPSIIFIAHKTKKCHVNRGHAKLKSFEMKAEILTKTVKYLPQKNKVRKQKNQRKWGVYILR